MSYNYQKNKEYENIQKTKIAIFCSAIGDNNIARAERYLNQANWDEQIAISNFVMNHQFQIPDLLNQNDFSSKNYSNFQPHKNNFNIPKKPESYKEKDKNENINENSNIYYFQLHIGDSTIKNSNNCLPNSEYYNYITNNLKSFHRDFRTFMKNLKRIRGIIIIFNTNSYDRLKEQIKQINEKSFVKDIIKNNVILPVLKTTNLGREFIQKLSIISFPTYIFCKYKDENNIYITDKIEGAFEISFFLDCLLKEMLDSQPEKHVQKIEDNFKNIKNKEYMDIEDDDNF